MIDPEIILEQAVSDLETRMGVKRSDILPEEWLALSKAAMRLADPFRDVNADAAGFPVLLPDGTPLWRLTIGAQIWLDEVERSLPNGAQDPLYSRAIVFACAHARDKDVFPDATNRAAVKSAIRNFERSLRVTRDEIAISLKRLSSRNANARAAHGNASVDGRVAHGQSAVDWAAICSRLEAQTGIPAHDWCWLHSGSYAVKAWNDLHDFAAALSRHRNTAHVRDEADAALEALQLAKVAIRNRIHPPSS